jgi:hypothetical protein
MVEWSLGTNEKIKKNLLECRPITETNRDQIWSERKKYFFKPMQDFGSKGSFKGANISRRAFEELLSKRALAQEYISAPEIEVQQSEGPLKFKYDLRFYTYQNQVQLVMARLYQGQTTNLKTPGGGFACVDFI